MPTLFSRKSSESDASGEPVSADPVPSVAGARRRSYTPSKKELGKATPKRKAYGRTAEAPPADKREAARRARQKQREARLEARAGMMAGKEEHLLPRDKGPERALVRNIVDARRNVGSLFLPVALVVVLTGFGSMPAVIRVWSQMLWFLLAFGVIVDSYLLIRRIKRILPERLPKSKTKPSKHYMYAVLRSISMRRMRMPAPQVKLGEKI